MKLKNDIEFNDNELHFDFIHSSGPGGQNVNKVATAVQLRFNLNENISITDDIKNRLKKLAGKKITESGTLIIEAKRYRSQEKNRQDAKDRFFTLLLKAYEKPKKRKPTKPTKVSRKKRLDDKKKRGEIKKLRKGGF